MKTNNKWAFRISSDSSNAMKSGNPTSGIGETHISRTLDTTIPDPNKGQGGIVIVEERKIYASGFGAYNLADTGEVTMTLSARSSDAHHVPVICIQGNVIDRSEHAGANGAGWKTDISYTLNTIDRPAVMYPTPPQNYIINSNGQNIVSALCADDEKQIGNQYVADGKTLVFKSEEAATKYIVRRLTPLECCRLQGFPDGWADIDHKEDMTETELAFWIDVRTTHAAIMGKQIKPWTKAQMLKWYNALQSDANVYKMWGNGIALPCALYVMEGIALALEEEEKEVADK